VLVERYLSADLSLFLFFILLMISIILRQKKGEQPYQVKLFRGICDSTMLMMGLDVVFRFTNGGDSRGVIYVVTWLYFFFEPVPMIFWLCYLDFYLHKSTQRLKERYYYVPLFLITLILMIMDPFTHSVFYIDQNNFYQRGPLVPVIVYFNIIILIVTIVIALKRQRDVGRRVFIGLVIFGMIPLLGNILQLLLVGSILVWPSVALAVIYIFLFLESQRDQKDYLTGLLNRQQIDDMINTRILMLDKQGGFALLMIDMDDFKSINDTYGHKEGDRALVHAAELIYKSVRSIDKVARFGGDEFLLLLEEAEKAEVEKVIARIHEEIISYNNDSLLPYSLKLSCGSKIVHRDEKISFYELIHEADQDMYRIKRAKKGVAILKP
jgi:diguanylate cyclase (GGDEF)-like protein